ncbi:MAG: SDR family oxidoreductase, partial [bacterium]|nr:SDR family oxidoreductase [bacterium]
MTKKRILVTGAGGFIGAHLVRMLTNDKYDVHQLSHADGDIADTKISAKNIDHVFHLAAKTFVPDSWSNPVDFYKTSTMGTLRVLEFCREQGCSLTFNSTYVYGNQKQMPISEEASIDAAAPYHHSKILAEDLCRFYASKYNVSVTVLRPFNIYGPGQRDMFLIPKLVKQIFDPAKASIEVFDLKPKRDYLYVEDLVRAMIATIEKKGFAVYNVGFGKSYGVDQVIRSIFEASGFHKKIESLQAQRPSEILDTQADISK